MTCHKCQGTCVKEQIKDPEGSTVIEEVWRCLNCGAIGNEHGAKWTPSTAPITYPHRGRPKHWRR